MLQGRGTRGAPRSLGHGAGQCCYHADNMETQEFLAQLVYSGKDPSQLIFEDELTGLYNRRFLHQYLESRIDWNSLQENPLSLMMMDVDDFKTINDRFGHETGDRALIWIAELIKEVAGDKGLAIRYAGDEFIVLFAHFTKEASIEWGSLLRQRIHEKAFEPGDTDTPVPITLSIGIASAPDDAVTGKDLVQKADTALYSAKQKGRDCLVHASEVNSEEVFEKTATYQLGGTNLVGRNQQISQVARALKEFSKKKNQFIIIEGSSGIGKSEFIEAIRRNIAKKQVLEVKLKGSRQEDFRAYYLIVNLLTQLLSKRKDRGQRVLDELDPKEKAYLSQVFPQFGASDEPIKDEEDAIVREGIFETLAMFIERVVGNHLLFLFIDDFDLGDEASMLLLRRLMQGHNMPLFICASSLEWAEIRRREERNPLERFYGIYRKELDIKKIPLTPLEPGHIARYMQRIFPKVRPPGSFVSKLAKISRGNPHFINEILRKLITDQKIILRGHEWVIQRVEDDYFPNSLDEILSQKIGALDEESRRLLEQVSVMGEEVPLSMLLGSSDVMEAKALEFIDKASAQGILKSDFEVNDEVIRFLGKQVLETIYGSIDQKRRQDLHEHIGKYHEKLYRENVLTSAASLAYHFKRSANREKADNYERMLLLSNTRQFAPDEAFNYGGGEGDAPIEEGLPIGEEDLRRIPQLIRDLMVAVRNVRLYPKGSRSVTNMTLQLKSSVDEILEKYNVVHIKNVENSILVNDVEVETKDFKLVADSFVRLLKQFQLTGIAFRKGLKVKEVEEMLEAFSQSECQAFEENYWKDFMSRKGLNHIDLKQVRYAVRRGREDVTEPGEEGQEISPLAAPGEEARWTREEMGLIVEIIRSLLGASRTIKLYPIESRIIRSLLGALNENLQKFLGRRGVLTLSRAEDTLLVNGRQVPSTEFRKVSPNLVRYFEVVGLNSLTFLRGVSIKEIETYINTLGHLPQETGSAFWEDLAMTRGLRGILFDRQIYEIDVREGMGGPGPGGETEEKGEGKKEAGGEGYASQAEPLEEDDSFERSLVTYPDRVKEMLLDMDEPGIKDANEDLFQGFDKRVPETRKKVIQACRRVFEDLEPSLQGDFSRLLLGTLLPAFSRERDPDVILEQVSLLNNMITVFIQFIEYGQASRILTYMERRRRSFEDQEDPSSKIIEKALQVRIDAPTEKMLVDDLTSGDPVRIMNASRLLAGMGDLAVPLLIDIIKGIENLRARKIAASLIRKGGAEASERLKNELDLETNPEERSRILDIIDTITSDIRKELGLALGDRNPRVRDAAFRLAERLNDRQTVDLLLDLARSQKGKMAVTAIRCLGKINPPEIEGEIISILNKTQSDDIIIACCNVLGQLASPTSIEALKKVLVPKGFLIFKKKRNPEVRSAAASALSKIQDPKVNETLSAFMNDSDPRIRMVAKAVSESESSGQVDSAGEEVPLRARPSSP